MNTPSKRNLADCAFSGSDLDDRKWCHFKDALVFPSECLNCPDFTISDPDMVIM